MIENVPEGYGEFWKLPAINVEKVYGIVSKSSENVGKLSENVEKVRKDLGEISNIFWKTSKVFGKSVAFCGCGINRNVHHPMSRRINEKYHLY